MRCMRALCTVMQRCCMKEAAFVFFRMYYAWFICDPANSVNLKALDLVVFSRSCAVHDVVDGMHFHRC